MKIMRELSICCAVLLTSTVAQASSLTGTVLINAGNLSGGSYAGGSYFAMGANNPNGSAVMLAPGSAGGIVLGAYQNFVLNPNVPHLYNWDGNGSGAGTGYGSPPTTQGTMLTPFSFFSSLTYVGTNPIGYQSGMAHPVVTADISACVGNSCTLSMELSAWEVMWNGTAFEQGPRPANTGPFVPAIGTYDLATRAYSITWVSQIKGGPFNGVNGYWHLDGTIPPPPLLLSNDTATTIIATPVTINVAANDPAAGSDYTVDPSSIVIAANASYGNAVVNANSTVTYTPNGGYTGSDSFTYTATGNSGIITSNPATVTVNVRATIPPTATDDTATTNGSGGGGGCSLSTRRASLTEHGEWPLLVGVILWLGALTRRRQVASQSA